MTWGAEDVTIEIEDAQGSMMLVHIGTPAGAIQLLGLVAIRGGVLVIEEAHVQGLAPGAIGRGGLDAIGRKMLEVTDAQALVVQGSPRTTGAKSGLRPRPIRYPYVSRPVCT